MFFPFLISNHLIQLNFLSQINRKFICSSNWANIPKPSPHKHLTELGTQSSTNRQRTRSQNRIF